MSGNLEVSMPALKSACLYLFASSKFFLLGLLGKSWMALDFFFIKELIDAERNYR